MSSSSVHRTPAALLAMDGLHHCYLRATCCSSCSGCDHRSSAGKAQQLVDVCSPLPALATMPRRLAQDAALEVPAVLPAWCGAGRMPRAGA